MNPSASFDMERFYQALGDATRLRVLNLLEQKELCVCFFVEVLEQPQPKISRHLSVLRNAGLVTARRQGTWMHYRIVAPEHRGAARVLRETLSWMKTDREMQEDRERLASAICFVKKYEALQSAPVLPSVDLDDAQ
jgi:ArsR family transcriptional regulator